MLRIIERKDIDDQRWNTLISQSKSKLSYGYTWYLDAITENWKGLVYDDYRFILPVPFNKKHLLNYIYQPPSVQFYDIFGTESVADDITTLFFEALKKVFFSIDYCLYSTYDLKGFEQRKYQILILNKPYDELKKEYSSSHKRNIKKAIDKNLALSTGILDDESKHLIKEFYMSKKLKRVSSLNRYFNLIDELINHGFAHVIKVYDDSNNLNNVSIFTKITPERTALNSINNDLGKTNGATFLVIDNFIKENANTSQILDFEGSNIDSIRRRNVGFGAMDEYYSYFKYRKISIG